MVRGMDEKSTLEGTGKMRFQDIPETKINAQWLSVQGISTILAHDTLLLPYTAASVLILTERLPFVMVTNFAYRDKWQHMRRATYQPLRPCCN